MSPKACAALLALLLLIGLVPAIDATTVERLSVEDLALRSQTIVQGVVRGSRSFWASDRKLILTATTIEVTESIKGQTGRTLEVTTVGGQIGDTILHVAGMPSFSTGEDAIVFVERSGGYLTVMGLGQGKFTVTGGQATNSVTDLTFVDGGTGRSVRMPAATFKNMVRTIVEKGR